MEMRALAQAPPRAVVASDPDAPLVAAAREDPRAFLALYDRYAERVLGYVRIRVRDAATCEDITSHVFTTALAQLSRFRGEGSFGGWLFQIARNAVRDLHRRPPLEPLPTQAADAAPAADEHLLASERTERLRRLVASLEPEQQHLLALRYGAGLAYDEIGAAVGAAPGTVRVRLHRILEDLRKRFPHDDA
jgi:RNA polymerase sigma-70 factor (ECF subfamily)